MLLSSQKWKKKYIYICSIECFLFVLWHGNSCTWRHIGISVGCCTFFFLLSPIDWGQRWPLCDMFSENQFLKQNTLSGIFTERGRLCNRPISSLEQCMRRWRRRPPRLWSCSCRASFRRLADFRYGRAAVAIGVFYAHRVTHYSRLVIVTYKHWRKKTREAGNPSQFRHLDMLNTAGSPVCSGGVVELEVKSVYCKHGV